MRFLLTVFLGSLAFAVFAQDLSKNELLLIQAAETGKNDTLLNLLEKKVNPNCYGWDGMTPLHFAVQNGHLTTCKILIVNGAKVDAVDIDQRSPLLLAVHFNHLEIAEYLIQKDANPNIKDFDGLTPLFYAAAYGDYFLTDMFLFYGGNQKVKDQDGKNPFMVSIWGGFPSVAKLLLQYGADVNSSDNEGNSSLMLAIDNQDTIALDSLISWGADTEIENKDGLTAVEIAILLNDTISLKRLINAGASVNHEIQPGIKTLDYATQLGRGSKIKSILIEAGAESRKGILLNHVNLGFYSQSNKDDTSIGLMGEWFDMKYRIGISAGIGQRPGRKQVRYEPNESLLYLLKETRTTFQIGAFKEFSLVHFPNRHQMGLKSSINTGMSVGSFKATTIKAPLIFSFQPQLSLFYNDNQLQYEFGYLYSVDSNDAIRPSMWTFKVFVPLTKRI
jgi:ankyrin repeat protein